MATLFVVLLLFGLICFLLAAFNVQVGRLSVGWLGLAFWIAVPLLQALT